MEPKKMVFSNRIEYWLNDKLHREDGPAIIWGNGLKLWYLHGLRHREDGPAMVDVVANNSGENVWWYINGDILTKKDIETAIKILSGEYPFDGLPLLINHPILKYFALRKLSDHGT